MKVQAHLDRYPRGVNKRMHNVTDKLANILHFDNRWRAKKKAHVFESAITSLIIGRDQVTGSASAALQ